MTGLRLRLSQSRENWLALDIPPQVSADLAEPWALVVAVVGLGQVQPDVFRLPPSRGRGSNLGDSGPDLPSGRVQVRVRPHLTGDGLLCVLLHEAVHVRVATGGQEGVWTIGTAHGSGFRAEVRGLCARIGVPSPGRFYCWPDRAEQLAVAAALRRAVTGDQSRR